MILAKKTWALSKKYQNDWLYWLVLFSLDAQIICKGRLYRLAAIFGWIYDILFCFCRSALQR
jgi:hypothetical protein